MGDGIYKREETMTNPNPEFYAVDQSKPDETPRDKFLRLAPPRTESALKRIKALGNLTGSAYKWEAEEAQQILDALFDAVNELKRKFEKKVRGKKDSFTFTNKRKG